MIRKTLLALAALTLAAAAQAGTYAVSGSFDGDPTIVLTGSFSFDDTQVAAGGFDGAFDLTALSISFGGQTFSLAEAIDPYVQFEGGTLTGPNALFATNGGGELSLQSFFGSSNFTYAINGSDQLGTLALNAVPEPASLALLLAGLGAVSFATRRRQT
jgi:hypothetical protein